jgi:hypothetical protein
MIGMTRRTAETLIIFFSGVLLGVNALSAEPTRWWPVQTLPKAIVRSSNQQEFTRPKIELQMLLQSVAGLAAKAVNESRNDELVWVDNGGGDLEEWYVRFIAAHSKVKQGEVFSPWELVDRYKKSGVIKGYILYRLDKSQGELNSYRSEMDDSVNVATSLAGVLDGIIVDEALESEAKKHGLKLLLDVRDKNQKWCFENYKAQFGRRMLLCQDPKKPHCRDLAIAHKTLTLYGSDDPIRAAMEWLEPLSPILGWNGGDEFKSTDLSSRYGHIQTATDWCLNLPVLMAGSEKLIAPKMIQFDPATINWNDRRSAVSFVDTDGDNVQWFQGNFFGGSTSYWGNSERGKIPFGWSTCFAHLTQVCPQAIDFALTTRTANDSLIEWGGGYYYPDHFASERKDRWQLLAKHAQRTWALMKRNGTRIIGFNLTEIDSAEARKAYEVFAAQTDGLLAIMTFQYSPYEGGAGKTFWVKDRNGIEVPVISARYSIWEHANDRPRTGTPAKVAREIRETVAQAQKNTPRYDWVIAHVWSFFKNAPGADENAEDMPQEKASESGGVRGYSPVVWCAERLPKNIRVISPEELLWRIRMQHDRAQTEKFMAQFDP